MLSRLPVRLRLAAGFAAGLTVVLVLAGGFVYLRVAGELNRAVNSSLESRADDASALIETAGDGAIDLGGERVGEEEPTFTQVMTPEGEVVASTLPEGEVVLGASQLRDATNRELRLDGVDIPGLEGPFRVLARPVTGQAGPAIAVVGVTTNDRAEALNGIAGAFAVGGPLAVMLASGIGYLLGATALAPVEAMRSRAREINLDRAGERLPTPVANDELRRLAETLNEMLDRVEGALDRERVFVSDASHELRTPLAILKSEIELIRRTGGSKKELEDALDSAGEEVDHLTLLAEDLLVIARAEQGRLSLRREAVDVGALLERVRSRFESAAAARGRTLDTDIVNVGIYELDPLRIEQALNNLTDNALRHGGGAIHLRASDETGRLTVSVSDDGSGFPRAFTEQAFERFSQVDAGRSDGGTGLGLAIVRAIARAHGGDAMIGAGSSVILTLPGAPGDDRGETSGGGEASPAVDAVTSDRSPGR